MKIGFHIRYCKCDTTLIAIHLAYWLKAIGVQCSLLSFGKRESTVHSDWDNKVRADVDVNYHEWLKSLTHVIWFHDSNKAYIEAAKKASKRTILVATWDDDPKRSVSLYKMVDRVVCMSPFLLQKLKNDYQLDNVRYAPVEVPSLTPVRLKPNSKKTDKPKVLINLLGSKKYQLGKKLYPILADWFTSIRASWTIWLPPSLNNRRSWLHKCVNKNMTEVSDVTYVTNSDWNTQRQLYRQQDLMIWPSIKSGSGFPVVVSLLQGTPVVVFNCIPTSEYISKDNGIAIPCAVNLDARKLEPDIAVMGQRVKELLVNKDALHKMRCHTADWTNERRKLYIEGWKSILMR